MINAENKEIIHTPDIHIILGIHRTINGVTCWENKVIEAVENSSADHISLDGLGISPTGAEQEQLVNKKLPYNKGNKYFLRGDPFLYPVADPTIPINSMLEIIRADMNSDDALYLSEFLGPALVGAAALATLKNAEISRRNFLKASALTTANLLLGLSVIRTSSGILTNFNGEPNSLAGRVFQATMPIIAQQDWWLNGRTAVLVAKTMEFSTKSGQIGALVMGGRHIANLYNIQHNPNERQYWIKKFIDIGTNNLAQVLNELGQHNSPTTYQNLRQQVVEYVASYDVCNYNCTPSSDTYTHKIKSSKCKEILEC